MGTTGAAFAATTSRSSTEGGGDCSELSSSAVSWDAGLKKSESPIPGKSLFSRSAESPPNADEVPGVAEILALGVGVPAGPEPLFAPLVAIGVAVGTGVTVEPSSAGAGAGALPPPPVLPIPPLLFCPIRPIIEVNIEVNIALVPAEPPPKSPPLAPLPSPFIPGPETH